MGGLSRQESPKCIANVSGKGVADNKSAAHNCSFPHDAKMRWQQKTPNWWRSQERRLGGTVCIWVCECMCVRVRAHVVQRGKIKRYLWCFPSSMCKHFTCHVLSLMTLQEQRDVFSIVVKRQKCTCKRLLPPKTHTPTTVTSRVKSSRFGISLGFFSLSWQIGQNTVANNSVNTHHTLRLPSGI